MVKVDSRTLDDALENSYVNHCMGGKSINIEYNTFISSLQTVVSAESQVNVFRSSSKLKSVFTSLDKNFTGVRFNHARQFWSNVWSPNAGVGLAATLTPTEERIDLLQLVIGSKLYSDCPLK